MIGGPGQGGTAGGIGPDPGPQYLQQVSRLLRGLEVEVDHDIAQVLGGLPDGIPQYAGTGSQVGESVEAVRQVS